MNTIARIIRELMGDRPKSDSSDARAKQLEAELASRDRLTKVAESEIERVWKVYGRITSLLGWFIAIVVAILSFLGFKTYREIVEQARSVANTEVTRVRGEIANELNRQFSKPEIEALIVEKAKERIDISATPLIASLVSNTFAPWQLSATNRIEAIGAKISEAEERIRALNPTNQPIISVLAIATMTVQGTTNFSGLLSIFEKLNRAPDTSEALGFVVQLTFDSKTTNNTPELSLYLRKGLVDPMKDGKTKLRMQFTKPATVGEFFLARTDSNVSAFSSYTNLSIVALGCVDENVEIIEGTLEVLVNGSFKLEYPIPRQRKVGNKIEYVTNTNNVPNVLLHSL